MTLYLSNALNGFELKDDITKFIVFCHKIHTSIDTTGNTFVVNWKVGLTKYCHLMQLKFYLEPCFVCYFIITIVEVIV